MMRTYNLLGVVEQKAGRLAEARAWYEKSRELAVKLQDQPCLGEAAQNIGIVCQFEGEAARERGDEAAARRHFEEALRSVEESLRIEQARRTNRRKPIRWASSPGSISGSATSPPPSRTPTEPAGSTNPWPQGSHSTTTRSPRSPPPAATPPGGGVGPEA